MKRNTFENNRYKCPALTEGGIFCNLVVNYCNTSNCVFWYWDRVKKEEEKEDENKANRETEKSKD